LFEFGRYFVVTNNPQRLHFSNLNYSILRDILYLYYFMVLNVDIWTICMTFFSYFYFQVAFILYLAKITMHILCLIPSWSETLVLKVHAKLIVSLISQLKPYCPQKACIRDKVLCALVIIFLIILTKVFLRLSPRDMVNRIDHC